MSDASSKCPVYVLGQVISREMCGKPADSTDIVYSRENKPFAAVKENGEIAVGVPAEFYMESTHVLESALMVFGPNAEDAEHVDLGKIFYLACDLKLPEGYGVRADEEKGIKRFSLSQTVELYRAAQDAL